MELYKNIHFTEELEKTGKDLLTRIPENRVLKEGYSCTDVSNLECAVQNRIEMKDDVRNHLSSWRVCTLGIPKGEAEERDITAETASLLLAFDNLELELAQNEGKAEYHVGVSAVNEDTLCEALRGLYGQADIEKAGKRDEVFPYRSMAVFERYFDKDYKRKQPENAQVFNWPSAVLSSMADGSSSVVFRVRPVPASRLERMRECVFEAYEKCSISGSLSTQASANASISISDKEWIGESTRQLLTGAEKVSQGDGLSASVSFTQKRLFPELLMERLKEFAERLQEGISCGAWTVSLEISAKDQRTLKTLQAILKSSFSRTPFSLRWSEGAEAGREALWITEREAVYFIQLPREDFPGFERTKNAEFALRSPYSSVEDGISAGHILWNGKKSEEEFRLPVQMFNRHGFVCGMTGAGKTNTMFGLLRSLNKPFLVIEPVKSEYYQLRDTFPDMKIFSMSVADPDVLRINPFWFPEGGNLQYHIDSLKTIISSAFVLYAAMPNILEQCLYRIYRRCGWNISSSRNIYEGLLPEKFLYPTFQTLCEEIEKYLAESDYEGESLSTYKGALLTRLQTFSSGTKGILFNHSGHPDYAQWYGKHVVLELEELADDGDKCIVMGIVMSQYYQYLKVQSREHKDENLRHLIIIEEAHRLFKNVSGLSNPESASSVEQLVEVLGSMMAEIRAYGEGMLIVDQSPRKIAEDVLTNSCIKLIHRLDNKKDIEMVNTVLKMEDSESFISSLGQGEAFICTEKMDKAAKIQVPKQKGWGEKTHIARNQSKNNRELIDSSMADYLLTDASFDSVMGQMIEKFIHSALYDSLYVNLNAALGKMMDQTRRLVFAYGNGLDGYLSSKEFIFYLLERQIGKQIEGKFPFSKMVSDYSKMFLMRCIRLYDEKTLNYKEISMLSEFRGIQIYDRLNGIYECSEDKTYQWFRNCLGRVSADWGFLVLYGDSILEQRPGFRYKETDKTFLYDVLRKMFLIPVSGDVADRIIRDIRRILA